MRGRALALLVSAWLVAGSGTASAQIYAWRDASGTLVLSDRRLNREAPASFPVAGSATVRSTRPAVQTRAPGVDELIIEHSQAYRVRTDLVRAVIQTESAFDPRAVSSKGAMGLMQLMPATAAQYGVLDPYDPAENIRGGVAYLRDLLDRYEGNEELALAAYNAGPGAVDRYGQRVPPFRETVNYVRRVRSATNLSSGPSAHRIYVTVEVIDGREVPKYTNRKTGGSAREVLAARRR